VVDSTHCGIQAMLKYTFQLLRQCQNTSLQHGCHSSLTFTSSSVYFQPVPGLWLRRLTTNVCSVSSSFCHMITLYSQFLFEEHFFQSCWSSPDTLVDTQPTSLIALMDSYLITWLPVNLWRCVKAKWEIFVLMFEYVRRELLALAFNCTYFIL